MRISVLQVNITIIRVLLIFCMLDIASPLHAFNFLSITIDGYTDGKGNYLWFNEQSDSVFISGEGVTWYKVTAKRSDWNEAIIIRNANIKALSRLGFDSLDFKIDLVLYPSSSPLFTKLSMLNNTDSYIDDWSKAFNSSDFKLSAKKSKQIYCKGKNTGFVLKYYSTKGDTTESNAIGLCKKNFFAHALEAAFEIAEMIYLGLIKAENNGQDPIYDMHFDNSAVFLYRCQ